MNYLIKNFKNNIIFFGVFSGSFDIRSYGFLDFTNFLRFLIKIILLNLDQITQRSPDLSVYSRV